MYVTLTSTATCDTCGKKATGTRDQIAALGFVLDEESGEVLCPGCFLEEKRQLLALKELFKSRDYDQYVAEQPALDKPRSVDWSKLERV